MENPTQNIFTREQLEQLRRLLDKDPTLFTEVTGKKVPGRKIGHVTITGNNLVELRQEVDHALLYMSGEVDE